jgi:hypothetical protein
MSSWNSWNVVQLCMSVAAAGTIIGSIGLGIITSESIQVTGYSMIRMYTDNAKALVPDWIYPKGDLDTPIDLLTDGPVVKAFVDATMAAHRIKERAAPLVKIIETLQSSATALGTLRAQYASVAGLLWQSLEVAPWYTNYETFLQAREEEALERSDAAFYTYKYPLDTYLPINRYSQADIGAWISGNKSEAIILHRNATRFRLGTIEDALWAYERFYGVGITPLRNLQAEFLQAHESGQMSLNISIIGSAVQVQPYRGYEADFDRIDLILESLQVSPQFKKFLKYQMKMLFAIEPRYEAIVNALHREESRGAYERFKSHRVEQAARLKRVLQTLGAASEDCRKGLAKPECKAVQRIESGVEPLLYTMLSLGYDFPDTILETLLIAGLRGRLITQRGFERRLDIEHFRRNTNIYATILTVSIFLGLVAFFVNFFYTAAYILNTGLLGSLQNVFGVVYIRSFEHMKRVKIQEERKTLLLMDLGAQ